MAGRGKVKRILSDSEDYDSKPTSSEAETEELSLYRPVKKKKMCLDSGSESDSALLHKDTQKHFEELNSASDEDEPLEEVSDQSKRKEKEQRISTPCDTSDDEVVAKSKISVKDLRNIGKGKNLDSGCEKNGSDATSDDEDEPLESRTGKSKVYASSNSSDDEPLAAKSKNSPVFSDSSKKSSNLSSLSDENRLVASDDEHISKVAKTSKFEKKSKRMQHYSSDSSDNEPLADKKKIPTKNSKSKNNTKSLHSDPKNNELEAASDKDKTISQAGKSIKSKTIYSSDSSDDEPLAGKKISTKNFESENNAKNFHSNSENDELEAASDKDETINEITKSTKFNALDSSSCNSNDESLAVKSKNSKYSKTNKKYKNVGSDSDKNKSEISSDEEPLSKIKSSKTSENSKADTSNSDSEDGLLVAKGKGSKLQTNCKRDKNHKHKSVKKGHDTSSDEEEPIHKIAKASKNKGKPKKMHNSGSSSDDEPLATKVLGKQKSKPQKDDGDISSDEEAKPIGNLSKLLKGKSVTKKDNSSSNSKIEHLKKYLRVAGIHINSYDKLFEGCKSIKSKTEKLLALLQDKGLKGRPTIEKCKKLKKKIETKKEIAELDMSNIIKSEGRSRRGAARKVIEKVQNSESSPASKKFSRLRDIIDSEESD